MSNMEVADRLGLLNPYKIEDGAPLHYKLVYKSEAISAVRKLDLPYVEHSSHSQVYIWTTPEVADAIEIYYASDGYSDLTILEFLHKTI